MEKYRNHYYPKAMQVIGKRFSSKPEQGRLSSLRMWIYPEWGK